jgi:hypothetical protein
VLSASCDGNRWTIVSSLRDAVLLARVYPALTCRAIICRPSGACGAIPVLGIVPTFSFYSLAFDFSEISNRGIRRHW